MKLYGKNPVIERIRKKPKTIRNLCLQKGTDLSAIVKELKKANISFDSQDKKWFNQKYRDIHTQGVVAEVEEFEYVPFSEILNDCINGIATPVFLDGITDPQNLGSIIRNLACLGGFSIVLPEFDAVHINETVLRVANGGENYLKVSKVTNLVKASKKAKDEQILIAGTIVDSDDDIADVKLKPPAIIIIGSEGKGIRPGLRKIIDKGISLPMDGAKISYNAAVAAVLVCYEFKRMED